MRYILKLLFPLILAGYIEPDELVYRQARAAGIANQQKLVTLKNNGYDGITFGISELVPEDWSLIIRLQSLIRKFSLELYRATKHKLFIRNVNIIAPKSWRPPAQRIYKEHGFFAIINRQAP